MQYFTFQKASYAAGVQDIKNSFLSLSPPSQFVPLLRLLVLSSHYFFITTRFLRCWCLASWSLDPVLFLTLIISFLSVLVFEKKSQIHEAFCSESRTASSVPGNYICMQPCRNSMGTGEDIGQSRPGRCA